MMYEQPSHHTRSHTDEQKAKHFTHPYAFLDHVVRIRLELDLQLRPLRHILLGHLLDPGGIHDHDIPSRW